MREALTIIAEARDSARLRRFLETGTDRKFLYVVCPSACSYLNMRQRETSSRLHAQISHEVSINSVIHATSIRYCRHVHFFHLAI